jgi:hypothetical protein
MIFPLLTRPARSSTLFALIAAVWIAGFLLLFFNCSIEDPQMLRTELWSIMADEVLGLSDATSEASNAIPPSGLKYLPQRLPLFGTATIILILAVIHGDAVCLLALRRVSLYWTEHVVIRLGTGLGILATLSLCCGLAGQLNKTAICLPAIFSAVVVAVLRWKLTSETPQRTRQTAEEPASRILVTVTLLIVVPFAIYLLLGAVSPPTDFDVREYHLQGPKEWFQAGQITFLRHNVYTSFPFLTEMLSLTGMVLAEDWWSGALVGQIVLACFQLLSALAVFSIARRWISADVAWLATLIYLTTPWTLRISLIAYAEGALTFYLIASVMTALLVRDLPRHELGMTFVCGALAGCSMATKYTGLISVILPTAVLLAAQLRKRASDAATKTDPTQMDRSRWRSLLRPAVAFGLGIGLMIAPWLLKNLIETGNPVYPLAYGVFGGSEWTAEMNARWKPAHAASEHDLLRIPEHIFGAAVYNKWTSGLLFALAVPAMLLWRRNRTIPPIAYLLVWGFATWWGFTHRIDRFWIPLIPLLSLVAGTAWLISASKVWKTFLLTTIAAVTLFNVRFCGTALVGFHVGLMDLEVARQTTIREDIRFLNETLPKDAKVLMVGEAEVFDATFPVAYNTVFDSCLFEDWTTLPEDNQRPVAERRMLPPAAIRERLRDEGITHVLINWGAVLRYRMTYGFTEYVAPGRFRQLADEGVFDSHKILLQQPWDKLSDGEQAMVKSWPGHESLVRDGVAFSVVELYSVVREN